MAVFFDIDHLPHFGNSVITIGTFDGVHVGHRSIINELIRHADELKAESVLITFEPHPRKLLKPQQPVGILTPLQQKIHLLTEAGVKHMVVAPFTEVFAHYSPEMYVNDFLVKYFKPSRVVIGYDHKFGRGRKGDIHLLRSYGPEHNYEVWEVPELIMDGAAVSSTRIRRLLTDGAVGEAAMLLGRPYAIRGEVVQGLKLGRMLGYPTANIRPFDSEQLVPAVGVYAVTCSFEGGNVNGMLNIGYNPTIETGLKEPKVEVHLFDFDEDIYGRVLEIYFRERMRDERKFESLEALKTQLFLDKEMALSLLGRP